MNNKTDSFLNRIANKNKPSKKPDEDKSKLEEDKPFINQSNNDYLNEPTRPVRASESQYELIAKIVSDSLFNRKRDKRLTKSKVAEACLHFGLPIFMRKHNLKLNSFIREHNLKY